MSIKKQEIKPRETFVFYRSFRTAISRCKSEKQRLRLYDMIFNYAFDLEEPTDLVDEDLIFWDFIEPLLKASTANYLNGSKPKRNFKKKATPATKKEDEPKEGDEKTMKNKKYLFYQGKWMEQGVM